MTRRPGYVLSAVVGALVLSLLGYGWWEDWRVAQAIARVQAGSDARMSDPGGGGPAITYPEFSSIRTGMTLGEVVSVVGHAGKQASYSELPAIEGVTERMIHSAQQWENPDGSNALVMFENGKVISKAQAGL